jgi:dihydrolipoamide dehydrogenase
LVVGEIGIGTDILIIGAGPAGYTAAIRCAQLGLDVTLIDNSELGGHCLHKGCVPVKTIFHAYSLANDYKDAARMGLTAKDIGVDLGKAYAWKDQVVHKLESGIRELCTGNGVQLMEGYCTLLSSSTAAVEGSAGTQHIEFKRAVIATGTHYKELPGLPFDGKLVINPDHVLLFDHVPEEMVIIGGGYAGITMASMIAAMGTKLVLIHKGEKLLPFLDDDVLKPVMDRFKKKGVKVISRATWTVEKSADKCISTWNMMARRTRLKRLSCW